MTENVNKIDYDEILYLIKDQLTGIIDENYSYYEGYNFKIAQEQMFVKPSQSDPKMIYIVLKFSSVTVHFGQTVVPVQIVAISEENNIEICRSLLAELVDRHNLQQNEDLTIQQIYESPVVSSSFNKAQSGFRALVSVSGTFVVSKNANFYKYYYLYGDDETKTEVSVIVGKEEYGLQERNVVIDHEKFAKYVDYKKQVYTLTKVTEADVTKFHFNGKIIDYSELEKIGISLTGVDQSAMFNFEIDIELTKVQYEEELPCVTKAFNGSMQLDTQPFFGSNNLARSEGKTYTLTYSIITFLLTDIQMANDVVDVMCEARSPFEKFKIRIEFKNGQTLEKSFSLVSWDSRTDIGEIPMLHLSFTS